MKQKIFLYSIKESFNILRKHKAKVLLLFLLEIAFFVSVSVIGYAYLPKIITPLGEAEAYISQINLADKGMQNLLGADPLMIYRSFNNAFYNIKLLLILATLAYLITGSISWYLSVSFVGKADKRYLAGFFLCAFAFLSIPSFLLYLSLNPSVLAKGLHGFFLFGLFIVTAYFMFVSFSMAHNLRVNKIKKALFEVGIKKAHYIIFACIIVLSAVFSSLELVYISLEQSLLLVIASVALLIFSIIWGRVFFILIINKLSSS